METLFLLIFFIMFVFIIPKLKCNKYNRLDKFTQLSNRINKNNALILSKSGKKGLIRNVKKSILIPKTNKKAFLFENEDSSLIINDLDLNQYTISFYIYTTNNNIEQIVLDTKNSSLLCYIDSGKLYASILNNKTRINLAGKVDIKSKTWYHINITLGAKFTLYINGIDIAENFDFRTTLDSIVFGISKNKNKPFSGYIGDVLVSSKEESKDEICKKSVYNNCNIKDIVKENKESLEAEQKEEINSFKKMMVDFKNRNKKCEFQAKGPTLLACNDRCMSIDKKDWGGELCTKEICDSICKKCDDVEQCRWLMETAEYKLDQKKPKKIEIKGYSEDGKIKITWMNTNSKDNIIGYYITVAHNEEVLGFNFNNDIECTLCEHKLINLINNKVYNIILYARNKYGLSPPSNKLRIAPKKEEILELKDDEKKPENKSENKVYNSTGNIKYYSDISVNEYNKVLNFLQPEKKTLQNQYNFNLDVM